VLPDYLAPNLSVIFVGTAAGERSAARGHYYSGRGNRFWELLWEAGLTRDRILIPGQDAEIVSYGLGLTDVAKAVAASTDSKLKSGDYDVPSFLAKIAKFQPRCVAFNGKTAAGVVARHVGASKPALGSADFDLAGISVWVLPSSSGSNNDPARFVPKASKAEWWREFGVWLRSS
jgi:TDG/mug DNA glycosylase family protein